MFKQSIDYSWEDVEGINPTGIEGELHFSVDYIFSPGCRARIRYDENDHPAESAEVEVFAAQCFKIDNKETSLEQEQLIGEWFVQYLNRDKDEYNRLYEDVCHQIEELQYCED